MATDRDDTPGVRLLTSPEDFERGAHLVSETMLGSITPDTVAHWAGFWAGETAHGAAGPPETAAIPDEVPTPAAHATRRAPKRSRAASCPVPANSSDDVPDVAERPRLAGKRDVEVGILDDIRLELAIALLERRLDRLAGGVQRHSGLAVADLAQCELQRALAPEVAHAQLLERVGVRGRCDRGPCFALERLGVHRATIPSAG